MKKQQDDNKKPTPTPTERVLTLDDLANINGGDSIAPPPTEVTKPSREVKL